MNSRIDAAEYAALAGPGAFNQSQLNYNTQSTNDLSNQLQQRDEAIRRQTEMNSYTLADLVAKQNKLDEEKTSHYTEGNKRMQYADSRQVSGSHYKDMPIQPWAVMESILTREEFIGFLKGNVLKYSMRAGRKEGSDDAGKAKHYMEKLLEMEQR